MFQFPRFPHYILWIHICVSQHYLWWVPSFGYLRINAYVQLPAAFRSLSRPSSAPCTKASSCMLFVAYSFRYISISPSLIFLFKNSKLSVFAQYFRINHTLSFFIFVLPSVLCFVLVIYYFLEIINNLFYAVVNLLKPTSVGCAFNFGRLYIISLSKMKVKHFFTKNLYFLKIFCLLNF